MPLENNTTKFPLFSGYEVLIHRIFNRHGGISQTPYDSLNISFGVADDAAHVHKNRAIIQNTLNIGSLISARQVHGTEILVLDTNSTNSPESSTTHELLNGYDAFISNVPGVALMVQQADCQAVLLFDPIQKVVANIHCGWRGSVDNIIGKVVAAMTATFSVNPENLLVGISPSLGPCCAEFVNYKTELPEAFWAYQVKPNYFDFWEISKNQLQKAGVQTANIELSSICTACNTNWFSYRRDKETGRFCSVIGLI
ncbi:MAG: peptidoglycan editing factor PgeF [Desulfobulbaceae bacterium]|uniref:Purine nucleoside phosphorylase n=1 Tax=Candidatus Desulfobia pelagia TaxID=2841692 RepID=A0A8J6NEP2_9BACT|nr:peptidoglycan editing factor PgeF [Candidatus Desulfobia pelagia]